MTTSIHASWLSGLLLLGPQNQHQPFNIHKIRLWICCFLCRQHIRLDYCNVLLTGLPPCAIWPLQTVQNGAACVVFDQPSRSHVTPRSGLCFGSLWLFAWSSRLWHCQSHEFNPLGWLRLHHTTKYQRLPAMLFQNSEKTTNTAARTAAPLPIITL